MSFPSKSLIDCVREESSAEIVQSYADVSSSVRYEVIQYGMTRLIQCTHIFSLHDKKDDIDQFNGQPANIDEL